MRTLAAALILLLADIAASLALRGYFVVARAAAIVLTAAVVAPAAPAQAQSSLVDPAQTPAPATPATAPTAGCGRCASCSPRR